MDRTIYRISLDVQANVCQRELNMRKKESGRRIIASLRDGSAHYHMEPDCRAVFAARKPDGKIIYNECIIDGCEIVYDITEQTTAAPGITKCEFLVYGGDNLLLVSPKFFIRVEDTVYNDGDEIESTSEFSALTAAMTEVNRLIEEVKNLGNDIDPEVLAAAVKEYLAANPVKETDPTVPAWAKQPTKPEYTAAEVGAQIADCVIYSNYDMDDISVPYVEIERADEAGATLILIHDGMKFDFVGKDDGFVFERMHTQGNRLVTSRCYIYGDNDGWYLEEYGVMEPTSSVVSVNGKTGAVVLTAGDVGALPSNTVIPTVPTKVSAFTNDKGYQTATEVNALINTALAAIPNAAEVAY